MPSSSPFCQNGWGKNKGKREYSCVLYATGLAFMRRAIYAPPTPNNSRRHEKPLMLRPAVCSLGLSATSKQYFSLRTNQTPATSQNQPAVLFSQNKPASAISHQPTEHAAGMAWPCMLRQPQAEPWLNGSTASGALLSVRNMVPTLTSR
jgi:hypothetical protein